MVICAVSSAPLEPNPYPFVLGVLSDVLTLDTGWVESYTIRLDLLNAYILCYSDDGLDTIINLTKEVDIHG